MVGQKAKNHNRIKQVRLERHKTQKEVGKAVGKSDRAIAHYEKGIREPNLETWIKLAKFFNVAVPYLQGISDVPYINVKDYMDEKGKNNLIELLESTESKDGQNIIDKIIGQQSKYQFLMDYDDVASFLDEHAFVIKRNQHDKKLAKLLTESDEDAIGDFYVLLSMINVLFIRSLKGNDKVAQKQYNEIIQVVRSYWKSLIH